MSFILGPLGSKQIDRFSLIFIAAFKMAENLEKQNVTLFAFLPPYISVSDSLVSQMGKMSMRSIDCYKKITISCLAARYSDVFVLRRSKWLKISKNKVLRFLAFYPLISVFHGSLVSSMGQIYMRSIDWYQQL